MSGKGIASVFLISIGLVYFLIQSTFLVGLGPIWKSGDLVFIEGENRPNEGFSVTTIAVYENSFLGLISTLFSSDTYLISRSSLIPQGITKEEFEKENQILLTESQALALYAAGNYLGYELELTSQGFMVLDTKEPLKRGDILLSSGETKLLRPDDFKNCNRDDTLILLRDDSLLEYNVSCDFLAEIRVVMVEPLVVGVNDIRIDSGGFGGPSAGLSLALEIVDRLGYDGSLSLKSVAATGIVDLNGQILPVGGIPSKVKSAEASGIDIFLVPEENYEEAKGMATTLEIYPVSSLDEAIQVLLAN